MAIYSAKEDQQQQTSNTHPAAEDKSELKDLRALDLDELEQVCAGISYIYNDDIVFDFDTGDVSLIYNDKWIIDLS